MPERAFAISVVAGEGVVARWPGGVAVAGGSTGTAGDVIAALDQALAAGASAEQVTEVLRTDARFSTAEVDLAVALETEEGIHAFVRGEGRIRTERNEIFAGPEPIEEVLLDPVAFWIGCAAPPDGQPHPIFDLRVGVVPGVGAIMYRAATTAMEREEPVKATKPDVPIDSVLPIEAVEPVEPGPSPESETPAPFESVGLDLEPEVREPLPVAGAAVTSQTPKSTSSEVLGIECSRGHFNNPHASYCQVCGISMVHLTHRLVPGTRPTLGFIVFADGATYALDRSYLVGRNPSPGPGSEYSKLVLEDVEQSVSREHARIELDGWEVVYTDLGSTNGSFLWNSGAQQWDRLESESPCVLASGDSVSVGRVSFTFERASRELDS